MKFLARSCKIVHILGALGKNLAKILTKGFRNLQDSWQEFQDILHWEVVTQQLLIFLGGKMFCFEVGPSLHSSKKVFLFLIMGSMFVYLLHWNTSYLPSNATVTANFFIQSFARLNETHSQLEKLLKGVNTQLEKRLKIAPVQSHTRRGSLMEMLRRKSACQREYDAFTVQNRWSYSRITQKSK